MIDEDITDNIRIVEVEDLPKSFDIADAPIQQEINVPGYIKKAVEFDPDKYNKELKAIQNLEDKKSIETAIEKFLKVYIYIRSVMSFYELDNKELLKKEQLNDWNLAAMKGKNLSHALLEHKDFEKNMVHSVLLMPE